jgi:hypothetical protein
MKDEAKDIAPQTTEPAAAPGGEAASKTPAKK